MVWKWYSSPPPPFLRFCRPPKTRVRAMTDQNDDKREMRMMWIATAVVVLVILGGMGINMLVHHDTNAATPETTQSLPKERNRPRQPRTRQLADRYRSHLRRGAHDDGAAVAPPQPRTRRA